MEENTVVQEGSAPEATPSSDSQPEPSVETSSPQGESSEETATEQEKAQEQSPEGEETEEASSGDTRSLSERTQKRIRQLITERNGEIDKRKSAEQKTVELERQISGGNQDGLLPKTETTRNALEQDPQLKEAVERLKDMGGFVTRDELDRVKDRMALEQEHERLKGKYPGDANMPAYDSVEVEDYARRTGIYNPEVAFLNLYDKERIQAAKKEALSQNKETFSETPKQPAVKKQADKNVITREKIAKMSMEEYDKNRDKIQKLMEEGKL